MSPTSTRILEFAGRVAQDDAFRELVTRDPRTALAEYDLPEEPGLIPAAVSLPSKEALRALGVEKKPEPPAPKPRPPSPVNAQLFDPE